jgi:uncharacterized integral membrane protein (TIGR00698 family)
MRNKVRGTKKRLPQIAPGVALALLIALPSWFLGRSIPIVGAPIFAIGIGMALSFLRRPQSLEIGLAFTGKKVLQYSIVFLGFGLDLGVVARVGVESLSVMVFTIAAALITAFFLGKLLRLDPKINILVGVGTAICGGSAIAAAAPVIDANEDEVAFSISTIFLFNIIAVFLFPLLGRLMGMSQHSFGLWAGTAVNDTSSVVAAAFSYGDEAGRYATVVKLTRTLMIIPITLALAFRQWKRGMTHGGSLGLGRIVPWFVLAFLAASLVRTAFGIRAESASTLSEIGKLGICVAMAAIGLRSNPIKLVRKGARPILLGLACWAVVAMVGLAVQSFGP